MATALEGHRAKTVLDAISRECARDLAPLELLNRVAERMRTAIACDACGWKLLDPQTLMFTGGVRPNRPVEVLSRLLANEFGEPDVIKFRELARSPCPAGTLWRATGGRPERSPRYRILATLGACDELRAVFRTGGTCWGGVSLVRSAADGVFSEADTELMAAASTHVAAALRRALTPGETAWPARLDAVPGVLVLDGSDTIESQTPGAGRLLREAAQADGGLPVPISVFSVAHQARAAAPGPGRDSGREPRAAARVPLPSGRWLSVDAAPLDGDGRVAIVLQPARPAHLAVLLLAAKGLTGREREVARMLLAGDASETIARRLVISRHTVRDHLKAIYAKFGVTSRPEFTALLLHE